jgi:RNA polymerase sigma-70 factor (ECF subfamily)
MSTLIAAMPGMPDRMKATKREAREAADATVEALVMAYSGAMFRVANSVLRNATEAEDAVQEAFLRVLKKREQLAEIRDARVWLVRIVWNIVLDRKRRMKTRPESEDIGDFERILTAKGVSAEELAVSAQRHAAILRWMEELPAKEREVMLLSALEELNSVEIAQVLGTTESAVRSRLFRARALLAEKMGRGLR